MTQTRKRFEIPPRLAALREGLEDGLEVGRARLREAEAQAEEALRTLYGRGGRELEALIGRVPLEPRLRDLRHRVRVWLGAAGEDEIESLEHAVKGLSRKVDRLAKATTPSKPKPKASGAAGGRRGGGTRSGKSASD